MQKPPGYFQDKTEHVLLLKKCLYSLKQSGREWSTCLFKALQSMGFKKSSSNTAKEFAIIRVAIDDLTITAANEDILHRVKKDLENIFKMKDLGEIHWLLTSRLTETNKPAQSQFHKKHTLIVFLKDLIFKMLKHIQVL